MLDSARWKGETSFKLTVRLIISTSVSACYHFTEKFCFYRAKHIRTFYIFSLSVKCDSLASSTQTNVSWFYRKRKYINIVPRGIYILKCKFLAIFKINGADRKNPAHCRHPLPWVFHLCKDWVSLHKSHSSIIWISMHLEKKLQRLTSLKIVKSF